MRLKSGLFLDQCASRLEGSGDDISSLIYNRVDLIAGAFDGFLSLGGEAFSLIFEVVASLGEIVAGFVDTTAELFAGSCTRLGSIEEGNGRSGGDSDAKGEPAVF